MTPTKKLSTKTAERPVPDGTYSARIQEVTHKKGTYGQCFCLTIVITHGRHKHRVFSPEFVLYRPDKNKAGCDRFMAQMMKFGLDEDFFKTDPSYDEIAKALRGRRITLGIRA